MVEERSYEHNAKEIEAALRLGIEVESDDDSLAPMVKALTDEQVKWISSWLASEGIGRTPDRSSQS